MSDISDFRKMVEDDNARTSRLIFELRQENSRLQAENERLKEIVSSWPAMNGLSDREIIVLSDALVECMEHTVDHEHWRAWRTEADYLNDKLLQELESRR